VPVLITIEGVAEPIPARAGDTLLDALLSAGVPFPYACQSGSCGTCKCELVAGDVLELECSAEALTPAERARNVILACRTRARGDARIRRVAADPVL
jgi:ferredoxin